MPLRIAYISADIDIADLTSTAWDDAEKVLIDRYWSGETAPPGRHFWARSMWSDSALYVRFDAEQNEPLVVSDNPQTSAKTLRLWERDVCELFVATDRSMPQRYFEFEIAPTGEWLDLIVDWTKDEPRDWEYMSGMEAFAEIEPGMVTMVTKIPWTAFGTKPEAGDIWLGNLFRQVGSGDTRGYLAWSPTMTATPQFHVPAKFGEFVFVK